MLNFKPIIENIKAARTVLIYTHTNMDGDAAGSALAMCRVLRAMGKGAFIVMQDEYPGYLSFLKDNMGGMPYFLSEAPFEPDLALALDISQQSRLEANEEAFFRAKHTACIDHHLTDEPIGDDYVVDPDAAATAVLVYEMCKEAGFDLDKKAAECLYTGIVTDTGSFRYSNADKRCLMTVAELYDYEIDSARICTLIFDEFPTQQLKLEALALERAVVIAGGMAVISWCELRDLEEIGADISMAETCIDAIRKIKGTEVAAFIKQKAEGVYKVSFRAKNDANVNWIARELGGGGHEKASGATLEGDLTFAKTQVTYALVAECNRLIHERTVNNQ